METDKSAALHKAIQRLRRTMTPNPDVMLLCDELEKLIGVPKPQQAPLHPAWNGKEPPPYPQK